MKISRTDTGRHRQPESGYSSDVKQNYRDGVWNQFKIHMPPEDISDGQFILILPGLQCEEIETALSKGYEIKHLLLVHESAARVATSAAWRTRYPNAKFYAGLKVSEIGDRLEKDNACVVAANLDFCNNFSIELIDEIDSFMSTKQVRADCLTAITVMKGRESKTVVKILEKIKESSRSGLGMKEKRLEAALTLCGGGFNRVYSEGSYVHSRAPMAWCVARAVNHNIDDSRILIKLKAQHGESIGEIISSICRGNELINQYFALKIDPAYYRLSGCRETKRRDDIKSAAKIFVEINTISKISSSFSRMFIDEAISMGHSGRIYFGMSDVLDKIEDFTRQLKIHRRSGILVPRGAPMDYPDDIFKLHGDFISESIHKRIIETTNPRP